MTDYATITRDGGLHRLAVSNGISSNVETIGFFPTRAQALQRLTDSGWTLVKSWNEALQLATKEAK